MIIDDFTNLVVKDVYSLSAMNYYCYHHLLSYEHIVIFLFQIYFRYKIQSFRESSGFEEPIPIDRHPFQFLSIAMMITVEVEF